MKHDTKKEMKELEWKSTKELVDLVKDLKSQLFSLQTKADARALKQIHLIKMTRRNIARAKMALSLKIKEYGNNR